MLLLPLAELVVGSDVGVQHPQAGLVTDAPGRVPAALAGQHLCEELIAAQCARGEPGDTWSGRRGIRFPPPARRASDRAPHLDDGAAVKIVISGFVPGFNRSMRLAIDNSESHASSVKQRLAALLGVQAVTDEPAHFGPLVMAAGCAVGELGRAQLYFQAESWLMDVHVGAGVPVLSGGLVTLVSSNAGKARFHPVVLRGFRAAAVAGRPVAADARSRLEPEEPRVIAVAGGMDGGQLDVACSLRAHQYLVFLTCGLPVLVVTYPQQRSARVVSQACMPLRAAVGWPIFHASVISQSPDKPVLYEQRCAAELQPGVVGAFGGELPRGETRGALRRTVQPLTVGAQVGMGAASRR